MSAFLTGHAGLNVFLDLDDECLPIEAIRLGQFPVVVVFDTQGVVPRVQTDWGFFWLVS